MVNPNKAIVGEGRPVVPTLGTGRGLTTPKKSEKLINDSQTVAEKYGYPWIRVKPSVITSSDKVCEPVTLESQIGSAPGRPPLSQIVAYKESRGSKKRRLSPAAFTSSEAEPARDHHSSRVEPTLPGDPPLPRENGGPTKGAASTHKRLHKKGKSQKKLRSPAKVRVSSTVTVTTKEIVASNKLKVPDLPAIRSGSSATQKQEVPDLPTNRSDSSAQGKQKVPDLPTSRSDSSATRKKGVPGLPTSKVGNPATGSRADLAVHQAVSSAMLETSKADLPSERIASSVRKSYKDVVLANLPIEVKSCKLSSLLVGEAPLELEDGELGIDDDITEEEPSEGPPQPQKKIAQVKLKKLRQPEEPRTRWLSPQTCEDLTKAIVGPGRQKCLYCNYEGPTKRLKVHVEQHFMRQFCRCGANKISRDVMLAHGKRHASNPDHGRIHRVDEDTYPEFAREMGWRHPPTFQGCTPTLGGRSVIQDARHLLKRKRDEDVLQVKSLRFEPPKKREAKRRHERLESKSVVDRQPKEARRNELPPKRSPSQGKIMLQLQEKEEELGLS